MAPVVSFKADRSVAPKLTPWPPFEKILKGKPDHRGYVATDEPAGLMTGLWECGAGAYDVDASFSNSFEFAYILEGRVKITSKNGESAIYGPGESIVTPAGFKGTWEILEAVRKVFAIRKV